MRVMLVDAPDMFLDGSGLTRQVLPMGLASIAAVLRADHDVTMLLPDTRAYRGGDPWGEMLRAIEEWRPDLIGITCVTATYPAARRLAALCSQRLPGVPIVMGGVHVSFRPREAALLPGVFAAVAGEGEVALPRLMECLGKASGDRANLAAAIPGVFAADSNGEVRGGLPRSPIGDLDSLPFPDRDSVLWKEDLQPAFYQAMITLRGCPYRCVYCSVPNGPEGKTRYRGVGKVIDEMEMLVERYRVPYIFYHDSVFTLNRRRTLELCDGLLERGLRVPFACQTRADRVDEALLDRMVEAGVHQIFFGVESGDANSLRLIHKDMPLEQIRRAVGWVKARGIRCTGFFMAGFPWETGELIRKTVDFACSLELDAVSLFSATPLPGTELWKMSAGGQFPESVDFRKPQVNLTALPDEDYARCFHEARETIEAYNYSRLRAALPAWPGSGLSQCP